MDLTYARVIARALIAGLLTGLLMAIFLSVVAEPTIDDAIRLEETALADADAEEATPTGGHDHSSEGSATSASAEAPLFSRPQQKLGGALAVVLNALLVASVFATAYAFVRHRLTQRLEILRVVAFAAYAFGATALFPMLKYPANPPAVGDPATVTRRTVLYVSCLVLSIIAASLVGALSRRLRSRVDEPTRIVVVVVATILLYGALFAVLPATPDLIPAAVPAELIWQFRIQSLGTLALLWTSLGLTLGWLLQRLVVPVRQSPTRDVAVGA